MVKCLYCGSDLIEINTFNCENEDCNAYIIGRLNTDYEQ